MIKIINLKYVRLTHNFPVNLRKSFGNWKEGQIQSLKIGYAIVRWNELTNEGLCYKQRQLGRKEKF